MALILVGSHSELHHSSCLLPTSSTSDTSSKTNEFSTINDVMCMLKVSNSSVSLESWILHGEEANTIISLVSSSQLMVRDSEIISNIDQSPFVVSMSNLQQSTSIQIKSCSHHSKSSDLLPLVDVTRSPENADIDHSTADKNAKQNERGVADRFGGDSICVVGSSLNLCDAHFPVGSGPLFSETATVTSLTFTFCTFTEMTAACGGSDGGSVISINNARISLSKRILQYEMKRKRLNVRTMSEQTLLEDGEISLLASVPSDWRVVLQDSITREDIQQGCVSLFDQIDSDKSLSQSEINHAIRFLNYTGIHIEYRRHYLNELLKAALPEEEHRTTRFLSSLINLVSLPSDALRTAVLSFFDIGLHKSSITFTIAVGSTGLLTTLFSVLKPHEIPLNDTTIEFHRLLVSIVDEILRFSSPENVRLHFGGRTSASDVTEPMYRSICSYLQYLMDTPACPTDRCPGLTLLLTATKFSPYFLQQQSLPSSPTLHRFFGEIWQEISEQLASVLGLPSSSDAALYFHPSSNTSVDTLAWAKQFECLLGEVSKGRQISDLGFEAVLNFLSHRPHLVQPVFCSDDTVELKHIGTIVTSSKLDSKAFWTLFTPTRPHHSVLVYKVFCQFMRNVEKEAFQKHVWNRWFTLFVNAVDPSTVPFTADFITFHTELVKMLNEHLTDIHKYGHELHLAFFKQTKDYIVPLSLHPFALDEEYHDTILDYLYRFFGYHCKHDKTNAFREEVRREMDESALSSSSPPFILTSELISPHSDPLILNKVDRIVALLDSDSCLDDDTILRICVFCKRGLHWVYLPELFRKAGRSTEQYFHTLESLLSLHVEFYDRAPIKYLLSPRPDRLQPTFDEWDDVDLETVLLLIRKRSLNTPSLDSDSNQLDWIILNFAFQSFPTVRHCASRLHLTQLERLLAPSVDRICSHFIQPRKFEKVERVRRGNLFVKICTACDQRVVVECLGRTGFFSRFVSGLLDEHFHTCAVYFHMIVDRGEYYHIEGDRLTAIRRTIPNMLEEGWQDAAEFLFVRKDFDCFIAQRRLKRMMLFLGANFNDISGLPVTTRY
ncbi:hypothetical protein BLNAU_17770 [Blattamonas nauphoetae]|uniref:Uncharacterized protein n=1 Tax=Blattamonas nauphoetae TaxID=2049346 RepID=A0ABQ9X696_9EUKA|nr:hypothetical protein BLNAU_17770 [Blattamonas nauphoetae]